MPSTKDWEDMYKAWRYAKTGDRSWRQFSSDWLMPIAGDRIYSSYWGNEVYNISAYGFYRSSSPVVNNAVRAYNFMLQASPQQEIMSMVYPDSEDNRSRGVSVRCVKNSPNTTTLTLHANWGNNTVIGVVSLGEEKVQVSTLWGLEKQWDTFEWWYTTSDFEEGTKVSTWDIIDRNAHLYAKWHCGEGYRLSHDWITCISNNTIEIIDGETDEVIQRNEQAVNDLDLYFMEDEDNVSHYTIMDRNLWATWVFNQDWKNQNTDSFWYVYQW